MQTRVAVYGHFWMNLDVIKCRVSLWPDCVALPMFLINDKTRGDPMKIKSSLYLNIPRRHAFM